MTITTTAIAFTLSSLGLMFCGSRFFKAFQKIGGSRAGKKIGILLSILHLGFALVNGTLGIGTLFFAGNSEILYRFVLVAHFFLAITAVVGIYLVFYILFPLTSPWPGVTLAFILGIGVIILTVITHPLPFVDTGGGVDLNFSRLLSVPLAYLLFLGIGSFFTIFTHSFLQAKSREVQVVSFILATLALIGILNVFIRFLFPNDVASVFIRTRIFDVTLALTGLVFLSVFLLPPIIIGWISRN